jgi:LDH2 family malate/lactate/ureidoglycolate dehydrogenase
MPDERRVNPEKLTDFSARVLEKVGVPKGDAEVTAKMLVAADLRGVDSHGVNHLKQYVRWIGMGIINHKPQPMLFSRTPTTASMDGDQGLGFVIGHRAMNEAIKRAEQYGSGFISVRNSTHYGAGAYYAMMALPYDMIGIAMTTTYPGVVPPGSTIGTVGTNPISVAIPAGKKPPFVLDMATSVVAAGKIEIARRKGVSIPEGWVIDANGEPVTDPAKRVDGMGGGGLLPLGGTPAMGAYKGFGLGVWVDIMSSILSGATAKFLLQVAPGTVHIDCEHFFGAMRVDGFIPLDQFEKNMDATIEGYEKIPTLPGYTKIQLPGGVEADVEAERCKNGIPLHSAVITVLKELGAEFDVEYDL